MPRESQSFEGFMFSQDLNTGGNFRQPVEGRFIREDRPWEVSLIIPRVDNYIRQMREEGRFSWIWTHQVDRVSVEGLLHAIERLNQEGTQELAGVMEGNERMPKGGYRRGVSIRLIRGELPGTVSIIIPNSDDYARQMRVGRQYDWENTYEVHGVSTPRMLSALEGLGQVVRQEDGSFQLAENPPIR